MAGVVSAEVSLGSSRLVTPVVTASVRAVGRTEVMKAAMMNAIVGPAI